MVVAVVGGGGRWPAAAVVGSCGGGKRKIVILPVEVETELKEAAMTSMGAEVSDLDPVNINNLCNQVLSLSEYRAQHYDDLKSMMNTIAPNLTALVGEVVGARLIVEGGGLLNLAKQPASTVQFLGADSALKTEQATPMCGLINRASLIGQVAPQHKGKIARSLAAKIVLAIRCDAFGHKRDNSMGFANRLKLQRRLRNLECILRNKDRKKGSGVLITPAKTFNPSADSILGRIEAEAEKDEEMVPQGEPAVDEKKDKKNKKKKNDTTANAEDTGGVTEKKKKKHVSEVETGEKKKKKIKHAEPEEERKDRKKNKEKKDTEKKKKKHVFEVEAREEKKKKRKHTEPDAEDEDTGGVPEKQKKKHVSEVEAGEKKKKKRKHC